MDEMLSRNMYFQVSLITFFTESIPWLIQSIVAKFLVFWFVPCWKGRFPVDWRLLVPECIAKAKISKLQDIFVIFRHIFCYYFVLFFGLWVFPNQPTVDWWVYTLREWKPPPPTSSLGTDHPTVWQLLAGQGGCFQLPEVLIIGPYSCGDQSL